MNIEQFEGRKREHLRHALDPAHQASGLSGFDQVHLHHDALPELNFEEVSLESTCLGKPAANPFFISGMTAGHADAWAINRQLALACAERGWAMGVGSQRRDLDGRGAGLLDRWTELRAEVPGLVLFANIGLSQLTEVPLSSLRPLVSALRANALVVHANVLQEAIQSEGTPRFRGALEALRRVIGELGTPVVLKETGSGFSRRALRKIAGLGLAAVDVSGLGGTHWGRIEGARARGSLQAAVAGTFANWGESTVDSVLAARELLGPETEVWASGGVRSGLDAAKAIALGADRVGYAKPALEAVLTGPEGLLQWMKIQEYELRVALLCTGSGNPAALRECREGREPLWKRNDI